MCSFLLVLHSVLNRNVVEIFLNCLQSVQHLRHPWFIVQGIIKITSFKYHMSNKGG